MVHLTERERIEILMMIGFGDRVRTHQEVCALFNNLYQDRQPISRAVVGKTLRRFNLTGNVKSLPKSGRPRIATNEANAQDIAIALEEFPQTSSTSLALNHGISCRSVARILKREKYHPYKPQLVQELLDGDSDRRIEFCERMMEICNNDQHFTYNLLFSDEATFCLNGTVNRHNCRYWSIDNPHWMLETHTQHPQKLNVWAGIFRNRIIGPFFINGTLTAQRYLDLLRDQVVPSIEEDGQLPANIWLQQDGAPPHYALNVRNFLNETFTNRWIGRRGFIEWPPRSPDLNPLDFFLWGHLKSVVYTRRPHNLDELQQRIIEGMQLIREETLANVIQEFVHRLAYCQEVNGNHFENFLN